MQALVAFDNEFDEIGCPDTIVESRTIASACMRNFRMNHMEPDTIAIIPEGGYRRHFNQSKIGIQFLEWHQKTQNIPHLQYAYSKDGEKEIEIGFTYNEKGERIGGQKCFLDGFIPNGGSIILDENNEPMLDENGEPLRRDLAIEVNGCYFHGHHHLKPDCPLQEKQTWNDQSYDLYHFTLYREHEIKKQMDLQVFWECEIKQMIKDDPEMQEFFNQPIRNVPINPRKALIGGRTGPLNRLSFEINDQTRQEGFKLAKFDITSLYPYINVTSMYPIGHPKDIEFNMDVDWRTSEEIDKIGEGIYKSFVVPPLNGIHNGKKVLPVIAYRIKDQGEIEEVLFPYCRTCSEAFRGKNFLPEKKVAELEKCNHTDEERGWEMEICTPELRLALDHGYRVTRLYSAYIWDEWSDDLFKSYMQQFLKIKEEASGVPYDDEEKVQEHIRMYRELFGVEIDRAKMKKNPGKRTISKLCLNSLWGNF